MKATKQEQYQYKHYTVTARFLKGVDGWEHEKKSERPQWRNRFSVTVKNTETGVRRSFQYTDSMNNWQLGKDTLTADDLKKALAALMSDAYAGLGSFDDFCADMGCDSDSRNAYATYVDCMKQADKVDALGLDPVDDYNALND
jgi:hypothetical protein